MKKLIEKQKKAMNKALFIFMSWLSRTELKPRFLDSNWIFFD